MFYAASPLCLWQVWARRMAVALFALLALGNCLRYDGQPRWCRPLVGWHLSKRSTGWGGLPPTAAPFCHQKKSYEISGSLKLHWQVSGKILRNFGIPETTLAGLRVGRVVASCNSNDRMRALVVGDVLRRFVGRSLAKQCVPALEAVCFPHQNGLMHTCRTEASAS